MKKVQLGILKMPESVDKGGFAQRNQESKL